MAVISLARSRAAERRIALPWADTARALAMAGGLLALYVRTLAPDVLGGDAGELQFVPHILSLTHPTGYPLQTLLGHVWARLIPWGNVAWRMNLLSAVAAAAGCAFVYGAARGYGASWGATLLVTLALGLSEPYWSQAIVGDKYALTAALLAALLWVLARWRATSRRGWLVASATLYGLGLTQHRSLLIVGPFLLALWLLGEPGLLRRPRQIAYLAFGLAAPMALYLWLPVGASRGLPPGTWQPRGVAGWVGYLLDRGFLDAVRPLEGASDYLATYGRWLVATYGPPGVAAGVLGIARLLRRRPADGGCLSGACLLLAVFSAAYHVPRQWVFYLPSFVVFALLASLGLTAVQEAAGRRLSRGIALAITTLALVLVATPVARAAAPRYHEYRHDHVDGGTLDLWRQDLKRGYLARRLAERGLLAVARDAVIAADWEQATALWYLQHVEGLRPDVDIVYPIARWQGALGRGRPTYLTRLLPGAGEHRLSAAGPLVRIGPAPQAILGADASPAAVSWREGLELVGYALDDGDWRQGYVVAVTLYLRARERLAEDCALSLRLYDHQGAQVWAEDRRHPVLGMYPTSRWAPGDTVADYFEVSFPRHVPAGTYRLGLIVYAMPPEGGFRNLELEEGGNVAYLPPFEVPVRP